MSYYKPYLLFAKTQAAGGGLLSVSDNFNRANANPIGGNWTTVTGNSALQILTNTVCAATASTSVAYWNANAFGNNQYSQAKCLTIFQYEGVVVRASAAANTFYYARLNPTTHVYQMFKVVAGSQTQLGADFAGTPVANDVMKLTVSGTTLELFINGISLGTRTDSSIASGSAGLWVLNQTASGVLDDWAGGEI